MIFEEHHIYFLKYEITHCPIETLLHVFRELCLDLQLYNIVFM